MSQASERGGRRWFAVHASAADVVVSAPLDAMIFTLDSVSPTLSATPAKTAADILKTFNVMDQAAYSQAAGDEFMSLRQFTRGGLALNQSGSFGANNNVLDRGQGDAGGTLSDAIKFRLFESSRS